MDKAAFKLNFEKLVNVYGETTIGFVSAFYEAVEWMDAQDFSEAVNALIKSFTPGYGVKFPTPAHLLQVHGDLLRHRSDRDELGRTQEETAEDVAFRDVVRIVKSLPMRERAELTILAHRHYSRIIPVDAPDWMAWVVRRAELSAEVFVFCRLNGLHLGLLVPGEEPDLDRPLDDEINKFLEGNTTGEPTNEI